MQKIKALKANHENAAQSFDDADLSLSSGKETFRSGTS